MSRWSLYCGLWWRQTTSPWTNLLSSEVTNIGSSYYNSVLRDFKAATELLHMILAGKGCQMSQPGYCLYDACKSIYFSITLSRVASDILWILLPLTCSYPEEVGQSQGHHSFEYSTAEIYLDWGVWLQLMWFLNSAPSIQCKICVLRIFGMLITYKLSGESCPCPTSSSGPSSHCAAL